MTAKSGAAPDQRIAFIVDDDRRVRVMLSKAVAHEGFAAQAYSRVSDVEAALTHVKPDLIVLDLSLGGSDAIEMMRSLTAARYTGGVMLISGHGAATLNEVQKIGERQGLNLLPFLPKPFHLADLKQRLGAFKQNARAAPAKGDLLSALQNNWLELWYQPKVDLRTRRLYGAEALVRLRHPERGVLAPGAFLPPAGDALYLPLTNFVIRRALSDWPRLAAGGQAIRLAINVPASVLQRADFVAEVRKHLPASPDFPGLIVEITEDEALSDPLAAHDAAIQLRLYKIHVSIDDFGTGYSTLARLSEIPFAELKLDRKYVLGCAEDGEKRAMCESVVRLAHRYGIVAVAEGVENEDDLKVLDDLGYDVAQGYYFAKPVTIEDFVKLPAVLGRKRA